MIKITVDAKIYQALQQAFPKPTSSAHRALAKYISVLEALLFKSLHFVATPLQRKLDLFAISTGFRITSRTCFALGNAK